MKDVFDGFHRSSHNFSWRRFQFDKKHQAQTIIEENEATNEASAIDEIYKEFNEDIIRDDFEELDEDLY